MPLVRTYDALRRSPEALLFEGARHGGVAVSFYLTTFAPGRGPVMHSHPYAEVFIVEEGRATFTVAGEELVLGDGHVVVVDAEQPHRFENSGEGPLRVVSIHPSAEPQQTDCPPAG